MDPDSQQRLEELSTALRAFYNSDAAQSYFGLAEEANTGEAAYGFHRRIIASMSAGDTVVDLGCGSAHILSEIGPSRVTYTGVDWSAQQMRANEERFANYPAVFRAASLYATGLPSASFDVVFSTYVIEHLVWPHLFLREMVRLLRPGGTGVVLAPEFRIFGRIPSLDYGAPVAPLKEKIARRQMRSAARHAWRRYVVLPRTIGTHFPRERFPFLINCAPTCLSGRYYSDNDAVYFVDSREIREELTRLGAVDIVAEVMPRLPSGMGRKRSVDTCFVAVRKVR
jgi:ubiquinone/menaquinone biosynthesis C-methylase UbiE